MQSRNLMWNKSEETEATIVTEPSGAEEKTSEGTSETAKTESEKVAEETSQKLEKSFCACRRNSKRFRKSYS